MKLLGIDIGTTSVKTAVFNEKLEQQFGSTADYTLDTHGDMVEFDAERYWELVKAGSVTGGITETPSNV